ncbi:smad nuclear interacting protein 1-like protein [Leptotrombidium deliense]|uniref:Smad nuclear interacting protein 1-like protein n=1 Tax=Leptotrombidium deliense TaxID=299467 RepID=A0A443SSU8_9ACAR|nr:smad nuclear interacting protein 1-like protein [Leptotrombidium deliense]
MSKRLRSEKEEYSRSDERRERRKDEDQRRDRYDKRERRDRDRKHERYDREERRHRYDRNDKYEKRVTEVKNEKSDEKPPPKEREKPNFGLSGKLAEDTNLFNGVVVKYNEPPEARIPKRNWRLYPFKGEEALPFIPVHKQSAFMLGRDRKVVDIPIDHPSCSKQHAVIQFRLVTYYREDGEEGKRVRPYIIDLESSNGTFVNNQQIDARRYCELFEKDVIKFGYSTREYVFLHEESKDDEEDDDVK